MLSQFSEPSTFISISIKIIKNSFVRPQKIQPSNIGPCLLLFLKELNGIFCCVQALVFETEEFSNLAVPLPAVLQVQVQHFFFSWISFPLVKSFFHYAAFSSWHAQEHFQEYIDHGSKIFKFYVIGDKVFHAVRNSMPNASFLKSSSGSEPLTFNRWPLKITHSGGWLHYQSAVQNLTLKHWTMLLCGFCQFEDSSGGH